MLAKIQYYETFVLFPRTPVLTQLVSCQGQTSFNAAHKFALRSYGMWKMIIDGNFVLRFEDDSLLTCGTIHGSLVRWPGMGRCLLREQITLGYAVPPASLRMTRVVDLASR